MKGRVKLEPDSQYISMADCNGYVMPYRLIMAQHLERPLTCDEVVHHKDGDKYNNDLNNLVLSDKWDHSLHHSKLRSIQIKRFKARKARLR